MTISVLSSSIDLGRNSFVECSSEMTLSVEDLHSHISALFGSWQGMGAANFQSACISVENVLEQTGSAFSELGFQIAASSKVFEESDYAIAADINSKIQ